ADLRLEPSGDHGDRLERPSGARGDPVRSPCGRRDYTEKGSAGGDRPGSGGPGQTLSSDPARSSVPVDARPRASARAAPVDRGLLAVPRRRLAPPGGPQGLCRSLARKRISVRDPPHGDPVDRSHSRIEERSRLGPPERPPYGGARSSLPLRLSDRPREGSVRLPPPHLRDLDREKPDRAAAGL